jgi:hypothetical protein
MIYIAAPYSHHDKSVVEKRVKTVCHYSAYLLKLNLSCVSPITTGTGILKYASLPTDFDFWQNLSYDLLGICGTMHVLKLDGWRDSVGVTKEIEHAKNGIIDIEYIEKDFLEKILFEATYI